MFAIDPFNADAGFDVGSQNEYQQKKGSKDLLESFKSNMHQLKVLEKIVIKKGYSYEFVNDFKKIDFLFIDGDHSIKGCMSDFNLYSSKIIPGGFIAFHDYYENRDDLGSTYVIKNRVLEFADFKFYKQYDTLWIAKKKESRLKYLYAKVNLQILYSTQKCCLNVRGNRLLNNNMRLQS